jgi:hypothetical protein
MYLLFDTEEEGFARSEQEGISRGYSYHTTGTGTRYHNIPIPCEDGKWALDVSNYISLTDNETTVTEVNLLTIELD